MPSPTRLRLVQGVSMSEMIDEMLGAFDRGFLAVRDHIAAHWPQHETKGDLHEGNLALHVGAEFRSAGCLVFVEAPYVGETVARCDLLVLCPARGWALAAEFKQVTSQAKDVEFAADARRLRSLRLLASTGSVDRSLLQCYVALAIGTWTPSHRNWWMAASPRPAAPDGSTRPDEWTPVREFLDAGASARETDIRVKAPHWGLVAVLPASSGNFWRTGT